jgi:hypothetical protein
MRTASFQLQSAGVGVDPPSSDWWVGRVAGSLPTQAEDHLFRAIPIVS